MALSLRSLEHRTTLGPYRPWAGMTLAYPGWTDMTLVGSTASDLDYNFGSRSSDNYQRSKNGIESLCSPGDLDL